MTGPPQVRRARRALVWLPGSADALGQRDDNPLRTPDISHPSRALVLADATDQPVAVRSRPINGRLQVMDLEGHVAQSQLVGGGGRRTGHVLGPEVASAITDCSKPPSPAPGLRHSARVPTRPSMPRPPRCCTRWHATVP
jgi:hypothetical protein